MGTFLGFDSSTQSLTGMVVDTDRGEILASCSVNFGRDLPQYRCPNGVLENPDPLVKHADPLVWAAALDTVLQQLHDAGAPLDSVAGISGSGQQHGSIYLTDAFEDILRNLAPTRPLPEQLEPALARKTAPIWMDSSTSEECREIATAVGERLQPDTGSPAIERFTGPQIRRFAKLDPAGYANTATIHLVSSFMGSLLCGKSIPIDHGDGAGMNLMNLRTLDWDPEIAAHTAPNLLRRLPPLAPSATVGGHLAPYFAKYGVRPGIPVVVWSGDNPNSLIGTGAANPGIAVISLGTSDTFFAAMRRPVVDPCGYGHVFGNPAGGFMSLICFTNGSLAREHVKDECGVGWQFYDVTAFEQTNPGQDGNLMLPYFAAETTPLVQHPQIRRTGSDNFVNGTASAAVTIRAVVESQALTMKLHSAWMGEEFQVLRVTGGASKSPGLCQVLANVFQARVEKIAVPDSAGLGAAMRAANAVDATPWDVLNQRLCAPVETVEPDPSTAAVYQQRLEEYKELELSAVES